MSLRERALHLSIHNPPFGGKSSLKRGLQEGIRKLSGEPRKKSIERKSPKKPNHRVHSPLELCGTTEQLDDAITQSQIKWGDMVQITYQVDDKLNAIENYVFLGRMRAFDGKPMGTYDFWKPPVSEDDRIIPTEATFSKSIILHWKLLGHASPEEIQRIIDFKRPRQKRIQLDQGF